MRFYLPAFGIIILAIFITVLRLMLPVVSAHEDVLKYMQKTLAEHIPYAIEMERMQLHWWGLSPRLSVYGLQLEDPELGHQIRIDQVELSINVSASLQKRQLHPKQLILQGATATLEQEIEVTRPTVYPKTYLEWLEMLANWLKDYANTAIYLQDVNVFVANETIFQGLDLHLKLKSQSLSMRARLNSLDLLHAKTAHFNLEATGDWSDPNSWYAQLYTDITGVNLSSSVLAFKPLSALPDLEAQHLALWGSWEFGHIRQVQTQIKGFSSQAQAYFPKITALDIHTLTIGGTTFVELSGEYMQFAMPDIFARDWPLDTFEAQVEFVHQNAPWLLEVHSLRLQNTDLLLHGALKLVLDQTPYIDMVLDFEQGQLAHLSRYLPKPYLSETTYQWLLDSVKQANIVEGQVLMSGYLKDFPFRNDEGLFQVTAWLEDGILDYQPGWPPMTDVSGKLIFHNESMRAHAIQSMINGAKISDANVYIRDLELAELEIDGVVEGSLQEMLDYLHTTELATGLKVIETTGEARVDLSIGLPLDEALTSKDETVTVHLQLYDNTLSFLEPNLVLHDVQGTLVFHDDILHAHQLTAKLEGQPADIELIRHANGAIQARLHSLQDIGDWLANYVDASWQSFVKGMSVWIAQLDVSSAGEMMLTLHSDLRGTYSSLPAPLQKDATEVVPIRLKLPLAIITTGLVEIDYGDMLSARIELDEAFTPKHAQLRLGDNKDFTPRYEGIDISGSMSSLDLDAWLQIWSALSSHSLPNNERLSHIREPFRDLDIRLDIALETISFMQRHLEDIQIQAHRNTQSWQLEIASPLITGTFAIPLTLHAGTPISVDAAWLDLGLWFSDASLRDDFQPRLDPKILPDLRITIERILQTEYDLENFYLATQSLADGLEIQALASEIANGLTSLDFSGIWQIDANAQHHTQLQGRIHTQDLATTLTTLNFVHSFEQGKGEITLRLGWPDAPTHFNWPGLAGYGQIHISDGRLTQVEPGAGRLLGLFSLQLIPRRLALDFRDLFTRGFGFDWIKGDFVLSDADVYTAGLRIAGPVAKIRIEGRTGILVRDYAQSISVTPNVSATLPLASALLAGPVAGLTVFIFDRLVGLGDRLDEVARIDYQVSGSWDMPIIKAVGTHARRGIIKEDNQK